MTSDEISEKLQRYYARFSDLEANCDELKKLATRFRVRVQDAIEKAAYSAITDWDAESELRAIDYAVELGLFRYSSHLREINNSVYALSLEQGRAAPSVRNYFDSGAGTENFDLAIISGFLVLRVPHVLRFSNSNADARYPYRTLLDDFLRCREADIRQLFPPDSINPLTVYFLHYYTPDEAPIDHDNLAVKSVLDSIVQFLGESDSGPNCSLVYYSYVARNATPDTVVIVSPAGASMLSKENAKHLVDRFLFP